MLYASGTMNPDTIAAIVDRAIMLALLPKHDLVDLYAEPYGGYTEPICIVRTWSKERIVKAILDIEYPSLY